MAVHELPEAYEVGLVKLGCLGAAEAFRLSS